MYSGGGRGRIGGRRGGRREDIYTTSKYITEKLTQRKKMERNRPDWQGGEGAEAFGVYAKKAQVAESLADVRERRLSLLGSWESIT